MKKLILTLLVFVPVFAQDNASLLFSGNCETCHRVGKSISAPSINLIKKRYKEAFLNKKEFIKYMSEWVYKPNIEGSIMLEQVKKYELMPHLHYDKKTLEDIASYIYDTEF